MKQLDTFRLVGGGSLAWSILLILTFLSTTTLEAQNAPKSGSKAITGLVLDDNKQPVIGATVMEEGTNNATTTNVQGRFSLTAPSNNNAVISFSFIGMKTVDVKWNGQTDMQVKMEADHIALTDVVVTGYQTISRERVTGSFSSISAEKIETKLQPSLMSVLEGQSAGMVVTKDDKIEIRGVSTFDGIKEPLIVVDGYPLMGLDNSIASINPENIESITTLKDAVAASIYGARASNGVIVITTKSGKSLQSNNVSVTYKGTYGITTKPDLTQLKLASSADAIDAELELYNLNPNSAKSSYENFSRITPVAYYNMIMDGTLSNTGMSKAEATAQFNSLKNNDALSQIQKYMMRPKQNQQHNISLASNTKNNAFIGTFRYFKENGELRGNINKRMNMDINNTWSPKEWLSVRVLSNVVVSTNDATTDDLASLTGFSGTGKIPRYARLFDESGNALDNFVAGQRKPERYDVTPGMRPMLYNAVQDLQMSNSKTENIRLRLGGDINIKFFDGLSGSFGGTWNKGSASNRKVYLADSYMMRTLYNDATSLTDPTVHYIPSGGMINEDRSTYESWIVRGQLNYNKGFNDDKHRVTAMFGFEAQQDTYETVYMPTRLGYDPMTASYNSGFSIHDWKNNTNDIASKMLFQTQPYASGIVYGKNYGVRDNRYASWYGNASYEFDNRYIVSGSVRLDLTNFFGTDPKYRYKPTWSVGGTWKLSNEEFFSGTKDVISRLNLRGSFGQNGNISLSYTPFLILSVGDYDPTPGGISYGISSYPNNQLRWEKTRIANIGLDFGLFKDRIYGTVEYYHKNSSDLLAKDAIDVTKGASSLIQNVGEIVNKGIEITLGANIIQTKDFTWRTDFVVSHNKSLVKTYNVDRSYFSDYARAAPVMVAGYPMDSFWGGRFAKLDDKGIPLFYRADGSLAEGGSLKGPDAVYQGTARPIWDLSWTNTFHWKNWDASFMFVAKLGHKYLADSFSGSNYLNRHVSERWRKPGDEATTVYPKLLSWNMSMFTFPYSDMFYKSANYLKLRDLTLSYSLPKKLISKAYISNLKVYFQARNLFYVTAKGVDIDPEVAEYNASGGTGALTNQGFLSQQLSPEFYFGIQIGF